MRLSQKADKATIKHYFVLFDSDAERSVLFKYQSFPGYPYIPDAWGNVIAFGSRDLGGNELDDTLVISFILL